MSKTITGGVSRGFTLIELLVVISIISLLSSVALASVNTARVKADDTQRNQIISEYAKALRLAYDKAGTGQYPATGDTSYRCLGDYSPVGSGNHNTPSICRYMLPLAMYNENAVVLDAIAEYLPSLPTLKFITLSTTIAYQDPFYKCNSATDCSTPTIEWHLQQTNQRCIQGAISVVFLSGTRCVLILN